MARRRLAERLRQFADGRITNDDLVDTIGGAADDAGWEVLLFAYGFWDDLHEHRLRGEYRLTPMQRRAFARCVLFLRSGLPYEWPKRAKGLWCAQACQEEPVSRTPPWKPYTSVLSVLPVWGRYMRESRRRREEEPHRAIK